MRPRPRAGVAELAPANLLPTRRLEIDERPMSLEFVGHQHVPASNPAGNVCGVTLLLRVTRGGAALGWWLDMQD